MGGRTHRPWLVLVAVALGQVMVVLDVTILNIALPALSRALGASLAGIEWAIIAYALAMTGLVPTFGRISDVLGRKRLYVLGLALFGGASALAAASFSIAWLIGARVLQAVGGALITSNALAILTDVFPVGRRGIAMGVQSILISGGAAVGPTLGGVLVTHFGWQWVFLVNVPIAIAASALSIAVLPAMRTERALEPIDWTGAGLLLVGLAALLLALTKAPAWGWTAAPTLTSLALSAVALPAFLWHERRAAAPLVRLALFRIRAFSAGQAAGLLASAALASLTFLLPFYWQALRGLSAQTAGLLMLPIPLGIMTMAPLSGWLSDIRGARGVTTLGLGVVTVGLFLLSRVGAATSIPDVLWRCAVFGLGMGMFLAPNNNAVMSSVPAETRGVSSGLLALFRFTGQSAGVAVGGTVFARAAGAAATLTGGGHLRAGFSAHFVRGFSTACLVLAPVTLVAAALSLQRGSAA